ncbi:MAG: CDP-glycerol glycerophosphotransferase family protein [Fidelibacterota bacterium]
MKFPSRRYLMFVTRPYSFPILEPVEKFVREQTRGEVRWFTASTARDHNPPGESLENPEEVDKFRPDAILVPGNVVPHTWPGVKVHLFHSLSEEKKGYYRVTGFFDLYCTPGPRITRRYVGLAGKSGHFMVAQTGWPKLDPLVKPKKREAILKELGLTPGLPVILYAPNFRPAYTSAPDLFPVIRSLASGSYQWVVKFHALANPRTVKDYTELESGTLRVATAQDVLPLLRAADLLITDTSSVAYEFLMLDRPVVTYRAGAHLDKGTNILEPDDLPAAIEESLKAPEKWKENRRRILDQIHPYRDGNSSRRVLESIENVLQNGLHLKLKKKPLNLVRKWKVRRMMGLRP